MLSKIIIVFVTIGLAFLIVDCNNNPNIGGNSVNSGNEYYPLNVDKNWIYEITYPNSTNPSSETTRSLTFDEYFGVDAFCEILTHKYEDGSEVTQWAYIRMSGDTVYMCEPNNPDWYIRYIIKDDSSLVGRDFFTDVIFSGDTIIHRLVDNAVEVSVTAGTFTDCLHYRFTINGIFVTQFSFIFDVFFAPDVGPVYIHRYEDVESEWFLTGYN